MREEMFFGIAIREKLPKEGRNVKKEIRGNGAF